MTTDKTCNSDLDLFIDFFKADVDTEFRNRNNDYVLKYENLTTKKI